MSADAIAGFDYSQGVAVSRAPREWRALEAQGFRRHVDGAKGETWYRNARTGRLAFEVYAHIPAATKQVTP